MANVKISQLPSADTPLAGTEEVPVVQGGVTKKTTVDDIAAAAGAVTDVTATSPLSSTGGATPDISIPAASGSTSGYLTSTDWNTFNNKQPAGDYVTGPASATDNAITRFDSTTGKLVQNSGVTLNDNNELGNVNDIAFDTTPGTVPTAPGSLYWDAADNNQTLSLVMAGGNAVQQIGEEIYYRVKASAAITNGQSVMVTGAVGASGGLLAAPASGLTANNGEHLIGVATEDIALNGWGYVTQFGLVRNINTTGASVGETWVDGDTLYYNPSYTGGLTKSVPVAPTALVEVAEVVHAHASSGSLFIRITLFPRLNQLANVYAPSPADNELIKWSSSASRWETTPIKTVNSVSLIGSGNVSTGDIVGPASATDNAVARFDGTTGKLIQNSAVTIADDGATVISTNSSSDALRITQTGAGNALVVEDSANPDSTPFVIDANGAVIKGYSALINADNYNGVQITPNFQIHGGSNQNVSSMSITSWAASASAGLPGTLILARAGTNTVGTDTIVAADNYLGSIVFDGNDGADFIAAASITALVDGTPGTNDMPGRLMFSTTADGASSPTERIRIDSSGTVFMRDGTSTTNTNSSKLVVDGTISETVGGTQYLVASQADIGTAPNEIPLNQYLGNLAYQDADSIAGNVVAGGGITANDSSVISVNSSSNALRITQTGTGNALIVEDSANPDSTPFVIDASGSVINGYTTGISVKTFNGTNVNARYFQAGTGYAGSGLATSLWSATSSACGTFNFAKSSSATIGTNQVVVSGENLGAISFAGDDGTTFIPAAAIFAAVDGTPGTNDMPGRLVFSTTADGASSPTERLRIDSSGNVGIGTSSPTAMLDVNSNIFRIRTAKTPASASDTGNAGDICWDSNYVYVCVATNTWKRSALATW